VKNDKQSYPSIEESAIGNTPRRSCTLVSEIANNIEDRPTRNFINDLIEQDSHTSIRKVWTTLPLKDRQNLWPELVSAAMNKPLDALLKVMVATYTYPYPPPDTVSSSIDSAVLPRLDRKRSPEAEDIEKIYSIVTYVLRKNPGNPNILRQSTIYLLLRNLERPQVKALYRQLNNAGQILSYQTLRHFIHRLSDFRETGLAFEILRTMHHRDNSGINDREHKSVCAHLLKMNGHVSSAGISDTQIFNHLVDRGLVPNRGMYKILVKNSLEGGDPTNAWKVYRRMVADGLKPTAIVLSLLLNDSKVRMDHAALAVIVEEIRKSKMKQAHVATDILHAIFLLSAKDSGIPSADGLPRSSTPFERMIPVYCNYFDPQPLSEIIRDFSTRYGHLVPKDNIESKSLLQPRIQTLVVMLTALLKESLPRSIAHQYGWFRRLVLDGNTAVSELARSSRVYNLFIERLGWSADTLDLCPRIVNDMIASSRQLIAERRLSDSIDPTTREAAAKNSEQKYTRSSTNDTISVPVQPSSDGPAPDVYTWATLLNAFIAQRKVGYAKRVLESMESRGVPPDAVAWNNLVSGYARLQSPDNAADAYDRMQAAGFEADKYTADNLSRLREYHRFITILEARERPREQNGTPTDAKSAERSQRIEEYLDAALLDNSDLLPAAIGGKHPELDIPQVRRVITARYVHNARLRFVRKTRFNFDWKTRVRFIRKTRVRFVRKTRVRFVRKTRVRFVRKTRDRAVHNARVRFVHNPRVQFGRIPRVRFVQNVGIQFVPTARVRSRRSIPIRSEYRTSRKD
jgi:pentatricopeptide repeat protein